MTTEWEWIVPFKGRNHSGSVEQNFLCRAGNVYVMDNHRAALWCWQKELDLTAPHSLMHIDRHPDALQSRLDEWLKHLPSWSAGRISFSRANTGGIVANIPPYGVILPPAGTDPIDDPVCVPTVFSKNGDRLLTTDMFVQGHGRDPRAP